METRILKQRENGEHDILIVPDDGTSVTFKGGWHEINEEGAILAIWSYLHPIYGYRESWVKMTNREMERVNKEYCGIRGCQCGSGIVQIEEVKNEPGSWWVWHGTDEVEEMVAEALGQAQDN